MPATVESVRIFLGLDPASSVDEAALGSAVAAVNALAVRWRPDVTVNPDTGDPLTFWPENIDYGANVFAAKCYGRRGSTAGVAGFTDVGLAYIAKLDPDLKAHWELGEFQPPVVA